MAQQNRTTLKGYFNTGDTPTEAQFADLIDSFHNISADGAALTSVSEAAVTAHEAALTITESQISDLGSYLTGITGESIGSLSDVTLTGAAQGDVLYRGASGWVNLGAGTSGQFLQTQGAGADPQWATPSGSGNVVNTGTPANNEFAVWTDSTTIEGISELTFDGTNFAISADLDPNADGTINIGNSTNRFASIAVDSIDLNGTTLDGTTMADPGEDALAGWDDSTGEMIFFTPGLGLSMSGTGVSVDTSAIQVVLAEGAFADGDKTKLDGIEAGADVTDTANVTAAGALMDSEVTNLAAVKAFDPTDYVTSDPTGVTGADAVTNMISLTQAEYDAITPDAATFYIITDAV